jgi:hypothetical protein
MAIRALNYLKAKARLLVNDFEAMVSSFNNIEVVVWFYPYVTIQPFMAHTLVYNNIISVFPQSGEILRQSK